MFGFQPKSAHEESFNPTTLHGYDHVLGCDVQITQQTISQATPPTIRASYAVCHLTETKPKQLFRWYCLLDKEPHSVGELLHYLGANPAVIQPQSTDSLD